MRILIRKACCSIIFLLLPCLLGAQATSAQKVLTPRVFVEGFYRWYVPQIQSNASWDIVIKYRSSALSPQLARLLKEDRAAQAACEDLIGLDFDPILNTQDPEERYDVGKIAHTGQNYKAEIYGVRSGKRVDTPSFLVEFTENNKHWFFVDFYYPEIHKDLLTILKEPKEPCSAPRATKQVAHP